MEDTVLVQIGDMKVGQGNQILITYALGSCVGISFYDPLLKLGALLHVLLPAKEGNRDVNPMKYADSGIHETLQELTRKGFCKNRAIVKMAGGAKMFGDDGNSSLGMIGDRNVYSARQTLAREGLWIAAEDVGGVSARTMSLDLRNGDVSVRAAGREQIHL